MIFRVVVEAEAVLEWNEAVDWYDKQEPGIGLRFNSVLLKFLQTLARRPERFPVASRLTRKGKILRWPYSVYFTINEQANEVVVIAIWHGKRNPAELRGRLQ